MTGNNKKNSDGRPDDFPLDITCSVDMNGGEGGDQSAAAGLPGSAPPPNNVRPGTGPKRGSMGHVATQGAAGDRSAQSESDDSGTARAGDNRRGSDRDSVRFQDEVNGIDDGAAAAAAGDGVKDKFQKQYRNVRCLKIVVILLLIVTAIVVTWAVYHFTRTGEQGNFTLECECVLHGLLCFLLMNTTGIPVIFVPLTFPLPCIPSPAFLINEKKTIILPTR